MHFAYPPRKSSNPPPFVPRSSRLSTLRRGRWKLPALVALAVVGIIILLSRQGHSKQGVPARHAPSGKPPAVIVTVLDENSYKKDFLDMVRENRENYAEKHGYAAFFPIARAYDLKGAPQSWAKVVAMRDALTKYPDASYFWYLDQDAFIMNPSVPVHEQVMSDAKIEEVMIKDHPVVPPDSIIKTFAHLRGHDVDLVITQDKEGLSSGSFLLRNSEWSIFFLETWFDPIYRSYNFQKAEAHALEHIVQWHPTILSKLALVPQRLINGYSKPDHGAEYEKGDIAVRFAECTKAPGSPSCENEAHLFMQQWRDALSR